MPIRAGDFFSGAGGSSSGAVAAGAEMAFGVDLWPLAAATYGDNFPSAHSILASLSANGPLSFGHDPGPVDLLLASPECTHHTCARGARARDEASRDTALYVLRFVRRLHPRWLVIENVVQMRTWHRFGELLAALRDEFGRHHVSIQTLDAGDFGVPQTRRRLFVICDRLRPPPVLARRPGLPTLEAVSILDPPGTWSVRPLFSPRRAAATLERAQRGIAALGEGVPFLIVYYGSDGAGGWQRLDRPLRTLTTLDRFGLVEWHTGEPTLRMLQVPELRRAMGFPETFRLDRGTRRERIKLLGNAVCPPVMQAIVEGLIADRALTAPQVAAA